MLAIPRVVLAFSLPRDLLIHAIHLPGKLNIVADALSRSQVSQAWLLAHRLRPKPLPIPFHVLSLIAH